MCLTTAYSPGAACDDLLVRIAVAAAVVRLEVVTSLALAPRGDGLFRRVAAAGSEEDVLAHRAEAGDAATMDGTEVDSTLLGVALCVRS